MTVRVRQVREAETCLTIGFWGQHGTTALDANRLVEQMLQWRRERREMLILGEHRGANLLPVVLGEVFQPDVAVVAAAGAGSFDGETVAEMVRHGVLATWLTIKETNSTAPD